MRRFSWEVLSFSTFLAISLNSASSLHFQRGIGIAVDIPYISGVMTFRDALMLLFVAIVQVLGLWEFGNLRPVVQLTRLGFALCEYLVLPSFTLVQFSDPLHGQYCAMAIGIGK